MPCQQPLLAEDTPPEHGVRRENAAAVAVLCCCTRPETPRSCIRNLCPDLQWATDKTLLTSVFGWILVC